ncbi:type II toxin-antitoxin system mRNA interferase toxin, RelE/StbE family [Legionella drozanskii]|uniref:Plasmid maintenance system killer protein n=1 Tax=Legionella drozanskii LLAP-1 TaxID=1212489 RepID=A0A0W0SZC2_9GAMM|nr:hypothetical protein Ldro_0797 [Legionella drozanskii LLAP-1]
MIKPCQIELAKGAEKDIIKVPSYIKEKLLLWVDSVERLGISKIRTIPGYHDEPLKGERTGQRSIRLNKAYRAIYIENEQKEIVIVSIIEVNKHDY